MLREIAMEGEGLEEFDEGAILRVCGGLVEGEGNESAGLKSGDGKVEEEGQRCGEGVVGFYVRKVRRY